MYVYLYIYIRNIYIYIHYIVYLSDIYFGMSLQQYPWRNFIGIPKPKTECLLVATAILRTGPSLIFFGAQKNFCVGSRVFLETCFGLQKRLKTGTPRQMFLDESQNISQIRTDFLRPNMGLKKVLFTNQITNLQLTTPQPFIELDNTVQGFVFFVLPPPFKTSQELSNSSCFIILNSPFWGGVM